MNPQHWRAFLALDLGIFNLALMAFAVIPPTSLVLPELAVVVLCGVLIVALITHVSPRMRLPGDRYAYLASGALALFSCLAYEALAPADVPLAYRVGVGLFMLAGAASGYAAHVIDGGVFGDRAG